MGASYFTCQCLAIFFHYRETFWRERRWKDFSEMLSMHHDKSTATCRLHVELSCRLHASSDNLWHFGGPEKRYYIHRDKKKPNEATQDVFAFLFA